MARRSNPAQSFLDAHREAPSEEVWGIGELAKELDTTARAIRFYESKGLLSPKRAGTTRIYGRRERARLQLILRGRAVGLKLRDIQQYLELYGERGEGRSRQLEHVIQRTGELIEELEEKRSKIETTLEELRLIRRGSQKRIEAIARQRNGSSTDAP